MTLTNRDLKALRRFIIIFITTGNLICPCLGNFREVHNLVAFKHLDGLILVEEVLWWALPCQRPVSVLLLLELDQNLRRSTLSLRFPAASLDFLLSRLSLTHSPATNQSPRISWISVTSPLAQVCATPAICNRRPIGLMCLLLNNLKFFILSS